MTDDKKEPRTAKPGTLLSQWWTLGAILSDRRTTGRHAAVAWVIIDRYMQVKGNGRASIRYIEKAASLSQHTVIKACRELVEWGFFSLHPGIGTRPAEYTPNWLVLHPSTALASAEPICSTGAEPLCSTSDSSAAPMCSESYLREPADKPASQVGRNIDTHGALPPAGLSAAEVGTRDPFDRYWQAYPRKYQKPKARAAWEKLNPNGDLAERIIEAAGQWAEHYAKNPVDKKWIPAPANWLSGERYDEDLPDVYADPKEAAIAKAKDRPATKPTQPAARGKVSGGMRIMEAETMGDPFGDWRLRLKLDGPAGEKEHVLRCLNAGGPAEDLEIFNKLQRAFGGDQKDWPGGRLRLEMDGERIADVIPEKRQDCHVKIAHAELIDNRGGGKSLVVWMKDLDGKPEGKSEMVMQADDQGEQDEGHKRYDKLLSAIGLDLIHNAHELIGGELLWRGNGEFKRLPYEPVEDAA